jgi:hypothetical protein
LRCSHRGKSRIAARRGRQSDACHESRNSEFVLVRRLLSLTGEVPLTQMRYFVSEDGGKLVFRVRVVNEPIVHTDNSTGHCESINRRIINNDQL